MTTPIYYVNDVPHVGTAYTTIAADIIARYHRLSGDDTFFLTGTDEHGQKMEVAAGKAGKEPKRFADEVVEKYKQLWLDLGISNDHFVRTTDTSHVEFCKFMFTRLQENGDIYKGQYTGLYCVGCEAFVKEVDLEDGKCPNHKTPPQPVQEESYFFKLSRYQDALLSHYEQHPDFISPGFRKQEIVNRVKEGLNDLSVSRTSIKWGIPIPGDPAHVMYVWIDALSNYISALGYPGPKYEQFWPADLHLIGKDILWFHSVIWPAMLLSAKLPLPKKVFAHGFWTVDQNKMSKALGNVVRPSEMKDKYGLDAFKYYLFSKAQFGYDNDFSEKELVDVLNTELADDLGNLVNRIVVLTWKYFNGIVPVPPSSPEQEQPLVDRFSIASAIHDAFKQLDFSAVLKVLWGALRWMNKHITDTKPWDLSKQQKTAELEFVLFTLIEGLRIVAIFLQPILPATATAILDALAITNRGFAHATWRNPAGFVKDHQIKERSIILFEKKEFKQAPSTDPTVNQPMTPPSIEPVKPEITYDEFSRVDLRTAKIVNAETFPDSKKLVKLTVDVAGKSRTIVAGIAQQYSPASLVGKTIIIVANLKPRKLHGVMSEGMLLAAVSNDVPVLLVPDKDVDSGFPVG